MSRFPEGTTAEQLRADAVLVREEGAPYRDAVRDGSCEGDHLSPDQIQIASKYAALFTSAADALELAADLMDPAKAGFTECPKCGCPVKVLGDE